MKKVTFCVLAVMALTACRTTKTNHEMIKEQTVQEEAVSGKITGPVAATASPAVIVYKTKADYSNRVPVLMDEAKERIVSFPHPGDLYYQGRLAKPTPLDGGYWLDNRGIGRNVAFLSYTYEEYSALQQTPSVEELMDRIIDRNPIVEWHVCGTRADYSDIVAELNALIKRGFLPE